MCASIGQKFRIRRKTKHFINMWGDPYYRTLVFLDEYWFNKKHKSTPIFTYKKIKRKRNDWRFKAMYEIRTYPPPVSTKLDDIDLFYKGVITGQRISDIYSLIDYEVLNEHIYSSVKNLRKT